MVDFQSSFAEVNGQRLHYISVGQGDLIMFVHGFPEFWREWENQLAEFGHDYQAVALDMRGYNLSSKPAEVEDYNAKHLVQDLKSLAEHLGHQQFTLVAHDWGGAAAWSAAMRYPECVKKLVIINSPPPGRFCPGTAKQSRATGGQPVYATVSLGPGRTDSGGKQLHPAPGDGDSIRQCVGYGRGRSAEIP